MAKGLSKTIFQTEKSQTVVWLKIVKSNFLIERTGHANNPTQLHAEWNNNFLIPYYANMCSTLGIDDGINHYYTRSWPVICRPWAFIS